MRKAGSSEDRRRVGPRRWLRFGLRAFSVFVALAALLVGIGYVDARTALGGAPADARMNRMMASPQWNADEFRNPEAMEDEVLGAFAELARSSEHVTPSSPVSVAKTDPTLYNSDPGSGLRITWLGHSTTLIEMDGSVVLTDPVWGLRASPFSRVGPKRWYDPPLAMEDLPALDAVVISHDHYDHLDYPTITALLDRDPLFIVPLGVGAHLEHWGVNPDRIVELDWWDQHRLGDLEVVMTPARHASGRHLFDGNRTLWAGYALLGRKHRVFFSGDTGMFRGMEEIGERLGPFDVTMIEVGTYAQSWADWHLGPEQAIEAHQILRGRVFLPIHWGLFNLSTHGWTEPIERVLVAANAKGVSVAVPRPGASFEAGREFPMGQGPGEGWSAEVPAALRVERWWPDLPWRKAEEYPVRSSQLGGG